MTLASIADAINAQSVTLTLSSPPQYSDSTIYNEGDFVDNNNEVFRSIAGDNEANTPPNGAFWLKVDPGLGELVLLNDIKYKKTHPITRKYTRAGPLDIFSWSLIEVEFFCSITEDMANLFDLLNSLNDRSNLASREYILTGLAVEDNTKDVSVTFNAKVPDFERLAPPQGEYNARVKLRIREGTST